MKEARRKKTKRSAKIALVCVTLFLIAGASFAKKHPPGKPIDLNQATVEQLEELPGIGPSIAQAIVEFREKSGAFHRVEDLLAIHGISRNKLEKLRPYVTVRPAQPQRQLP